MAESLNCSERSLRWHLNEEGVQYSELIEKTRFARAADGLNRRVVLGGRVQNRQNRLCMLGRIPP